MTSSVPKTAEFPSTVDFSRMDDRAAIDHVYARYVPILQAILSSRLRLQGSDDTLDILHGFLVERVITDENQEAIGVLRGWNREKGKFRWYLLRALDHYVKDRFRRSARQRDLHPDVEAQLPNRFNVVPESEVRWVQAVFEMAWARFESEARPKYVDIYRRRIVDPLCYGVPEPSYDDLKDLCGYTSAGQVAGVLHRARQKFDEYLMAVVRDFGGCINDDELHAEYCRIRAVLDDNVARRKLAWFLRDDCPDQVVEALSDDKELLVQSVFDTMSWSFGVPTTEDDELFQVLRHDVLHLPFDVDGLVARIVADEPISFVTLEEILRVHRGPEIHMPSLTLLRTIRNLVKPIARHGGHPNLSANNARVLYCAVDAAGIVTYGEHGRMTTRDNRSQIKNFNGALRRECLPARMCHVLREAIDSLEADS